MVLEEIDIFLTFKSQILVLEKEIDCEFPYLNILS